MKERRDDSHAVFLGGGPNDVRFVSQSAGVDSGTAPRDNVGVRFRRLERRFDKAKQMAQVSAATAARDSGPDRAAALVRYDNDEFRSKMCQSVLDAGDARPGLAARRG